MEAADVRVGIDRAARLPPRRRHVRPDAVQPRHRGDQALRIGVVRRVEHGLRRPGLHHTAQVHHYHPVAQQPHHVQVVADEHISHAQRRPQLRQQLQHRHLNRHIQRRRRLVQDQQVRPWPDRPGDAHTRPLPARQLVREAAQQRRFQPAQPRRLFHLLPQCRTAQPAQAAQRVGDSVGGGEARVDALPGILEHHLDARPVRVPREPPGREQRQLAPVQPNHPLCRVQQPRQQAHQGGLAAPALPNQPHGVSPVQHEADIIDGMHLRHMRRRSPQPGQPGPAA